MSALALCELGQRLFGDGDRSGAAKAYEQAVECDPTLVHARYNLATLFLHLNRPEEAQPHLETVIDAVAVSYTHLRAHETPEHLVCRLLLEKKKKKSKNKKKYICTL
eukprot:TRINITY_DN63867_c0_g1_i1.p3 TRINITY_DN63867_c0_g1~~TRINITY_DN63867_c0_g1_i1.p3  ORF type:complete len:107 (+),score=28.89 TRINITY_DN63867_c0_g1_i1:227-547(+)